MAGAAYRIPKAFVIPRRSPPFFRRRVSQATQFHNGRGERFLIHGAFQNSIGILLVIDDPAGIVPLETNMFDCCRHVSLTHLFCF
jgi:hypothetical protein